jgi:ABC-type multidrug transport system ATPase subunit
LSQCNGILVMNKGKLVAAGPATDILPKLGMNVAK